MKLCRFLVQEQVHLGVATESGVIDLTACGFGTSMNALIEAGAPAMQAIKAVAAAPGFARLPQDSLRYATICDPGKIVCIGLNYRQHAIESGDDIPTAPVLFSKFNDSLCAHGDVIPLPAAAQEFDHEAELVVIIGKPAWEVPAEKALEYVFGYACGNDFCARDAQALSSQWLAGKGGLAYGPAGPFITTADDYDPLADKAIYCEINGERVQSGTIADMIFPVPQLISFTSRFFHLQPGDLIFTGTPSGVIDGAGGSRPWLKRGDHMAVVIEGLGRLENTLG